MRRPAAAVRAAALSTLLCLGACSSVPPGVLDRTAHGRTIEGRLSVRYQDAETSKEDALSGRFVWTDGTDGVELSLLDPLGQTVALIRSSATRSSITFRDGRSVDGATPEALTQRTLGWTVPLKGLRYWLDGRPDPGSTATPLADGRLRQDGWTLRFVAPEGAAADAPPRRVDLSFPGPPVEIEMRLVIDQRSDA